MAVAAFNDGHFKPRVIAFSDQSNFCWSRTHAASTFFGDGNSAAQLVELDFVGLASDFHDVCLRHVGRRFHQSIGERAVVGHQQQAFAGPVQPPHGIHAPFHLLHQVHYRGTFFLIADRGHIALGFVQHDVAETLGPLQQFAIDAYVVLFRIGLGAEFGDHLTIDLHAAGNDHFFGLAAGCNPGSSDNLLQTFGRHG